MKVPKWMWNPVSDRKLFSPYSTLPTDPHEVGQTGVKVQNPHDLLADSKPAWG